MKLVQLNVWFGKRYKQLDSFIARQMADTKLFCFQEMLDFKEGADLSGIPGGEGGVPNLYERISKRLDGFNGVLGEPYSNFGESLAIFSSKDVKVEDHGEIVLCEPKEMSIAGRPYWVGSRLLYITFSLNGRRINVATVHGLWTNKVVDKVDTPERIRQSELILDFMKRKNNLTVICGDFNLRPDIKSVELLETRTRNLIKEYNVQTTRNEFTKPDAGRFADYVFISPELRVNGFEVPYETVSDHLPLIVDFD